MWPERIERMASSINDRLIDRSMPFAGQAVSIKLQQQLVMHGRRGRSLHLDNSRLDLLLFSAACAVCFGHVLDAGLLKCVWGILHSLDRSHRNGDVPSGQKLTQTRLAWWILCMGGCPKPEHAHAMARQLGLQESPQQVEFGV